MVILDCGITEAERKQIFHGGQCCFRGPFAAILQHFQDVASEGRLPCAVILDCGITEAERKQIFHGELFCFPGPFAVIHGEPQSPGGPCPGPGTTTGPRGCDRDPDPDCPPSQELHPVCP